MDMALDTVSFPYWSPLLRRFAPDSLFFASGNVERELLAKQDPTKQRKIDDLLMSERGSLLLSEDILSQAVLAVSLAVCKAGADVCGLSLCDHIALFAANKRLMLPIPSFMLMNSAFQEFMIIPYGASSFEEAVEMSVEVHRQLKVKTVKY